MLALLKEKHQNTIENSTKISSINSKTYNFNCCIVCLNIFNINNNATAMAQDIFLAFLARHRVLSQIDIGVLLFQAQMIFLLLPA